jgi:hypothetical protein
MISAIAAFLLAADTLANPAGFAMAVTVEMRVVTNPVEPGRDFEVEGTVGNPTDEQISGCIGASRLFRVEGSKETVRVPLADREAGRCRTGGTFSLDPGRHFHWRETLPAGETIGDGPGKLVGSFAVHEWRRSSAAEEEVDVRWEIVREAPFTAASR